MTAEEARKEAQLVRRDLAAKTDITTELAAVAKAVAFGKFCVWVECEDKPEVKTNKMLALRTLGYSVVDEDNELLIDW